MRFVIDLHVFPIGIFFFIGEEELPKFLKATGKKSIDVDNDGYASNNAIFIRDATRIDVIAHEIHHAKKFVVDTLGIEDEETEAYLLSYILKEALHKIDKKNKKIVDKI